MRETIFKFELSHTLADITVSDAPVSISEFKIWPQNLATKINMDIQTKSKRVCSRGSPFAAVFFTF